MPGAVQSAASLEQLRWRCRRGMLELDLLLNDFLDTHFERFDHQQRALFETLLDYPDQLLLDILLGNVPVSDPALADFVLRVRRNPVTVD